MMQTLSRNQKGMTFIEMMIVIAIVAIVVSMTGIGISFAYSKDAQVCARSIDEQLSNLRMLSMGKQGTWELEIQSNSSENMIYVMQDGAILETVCLPRKVELSYDIGDGVLQRGNMKLAFHKSEGSIGKLEFVTESGSVITTIPGYITIYVKSDNAQKEAKVILVTATGKHYVEYE
ncbi:MAG: prepilin-type N-terminal cleavage/methylation domain-containing protein [Lachnospiraceae bacterium]|nr:prepilin-type N-terminal cleavage/methylation domain-containing protein [Lachnospiraceae bacterium]